MARIELKDLLDLLRECGGVDDSVNLDGDVLDVTFTDLGYDSLALLQTAGRVERDYGLTLDEEAVGEAQTPRGFLDLVNAAVPNGAA